MICKEIANPPLPPEYKAANHWKMICRLFYFPEKDFEKDLCESAIPTRSGSLPLQERFEFSDTGIFLSGDSANRENAKTGNRLQTEDAEFLFQKPTRQTEELSTCMLVRSSKPK